MSKAQIACDLRKLADAVDGLNELGPSPNKAFALVLVRAEIVCSRSPMSPELEGLRRAIQQYWNAVRGLKESDDNRV